MKQSLQRKISKLAAIMLCKTHTHNHTHTQRREETITPKRILFSEIFTVNFQVGNHNTTLKKEKKESHSETVLF